MSTSNGLCGENTIEKQRDFKAILNHHINVCKYIIKNGKAEECYYYFDAFAGPGIYTNDDNVIVGSPVIFQQVIRNYDINYKACFYEKDTDRYNRLCSCIFLKNNVFVFHGDNQELIALDKIPIYNRLGLLYCDPPNTEDTIDYSFELARKFSELYPMTDIMIYLGASTLKRIRGAFNRGEKLLNRLKPIKKDYWVIKKNGGKWQWTFLIGTNYSKWAKWEKKGFYLADSPEGHAILIEASLTKQELKNYYQPSLF